MPSSTKRKMTDLETDCYMRGAVRGFIWGLAIGCVLGVLAFIAGINAGRG